MNPGYFSFILARYLRSNHCKIRVRGSTTHSCPICILSLLSCNRREATSHADNIIVPSLRTFSVFPSFVSGRDIPHLTIAISTGFIKNKLKIKSPIVYGNLIIVNSFFPRDLYFLSLNKVSDRIE